MRKRTFSEHQVMSQHHRREILDATALVTPHNRASLGALRALIPTGEGQEGGEGQGAITQA